MYNFFKQLAGSINAFLCEQAHQKRDENTPGRDMATTSPKLSKPTLITRPHLTTNPTLNRHLEDFVCDAFLRSRLPWPEKWDLSNRRFRPESTLADMLGDEGFMCVIYDENEDGPKIGNGSGKVIACAAAVPWAGGWTKEGKHTEEGWEIKTVCVSGEEAYAKKGLAVKVMKHVEDQACAERVGEKSDAPTD